jgi:uncharacterized membrane protein HdeD (DUF308 family)
VNERTSVLAGWAGEAKRNAGWLIFLGVVMIILGVIAIASPFITGLAVTVVVGAMLTISGIARTIAAFKADSFGQGALAFIGGVLVTIAGLIMMFRPGLGLATLTLMLAAVFITKGVFEIIMSFRMKPEKGWGWMLFNGIAAVLLGIFLMAEWPMSGNWAIGTLAGIEILVSGWTMVSIGGAARSAASEVEDAA